MREALLVDEVVPAVAVSMEQVLEVVILNQSG